MDRTKPQLREWPVLQDRTTRLRSARPLHLIASCGGPAPKHEPRGVAEEQSTRDGIRSPIMEWPGPPGGAGPILALITEGRTTAMEIATLDLDLGKRVVHVVGLDRAGSIVLRRRVSRDRVLTLTANLPRCVIGIEACCGAHHLGRNLTAQGHEVRLMPPEYVRPYVKNNKK
jgi:hypothetical protein